MSRQRSSTRRCTPTLRLLTVAVAFALLASKVQSTEPAKLGPANLGPAKLEPVKLEPVKLEPGTHQLFLDDAMILERSNVISSFHAPRKFDGNPVLMPELGVETNALLYGTVLHDEEAGLFKMWYSTGRVGTKTPWALAYATSKDGVFVPTRPVEYHILNSPASSSCSTVP